MWEHVVFDLIHMKKVFLIPTGLSIIYLVSNGLFMNQSNIVTFGIIELVFLLWLGWYLKNEGLKIFDVGLWAVLAGLAAKVILTVLGVIVMISVGVEPFAIGGTPFIKTFIPNTIAASIGIFIITVISAIVTEHLRKKPPT